MTQGSPSTTRLARTCSPPQRPSPPQLHTLPCSHPLLCRHLSSPPTNMEYGGQGPFSPYSDLWVFQVPGTLVGLHLPSLREDLAGFRGSGEPNSRLPPHPGVPAPPVWWGRWWHHAGPDRVQRRPWLQRPPRGGSWPPHLLTPGPDSAVITRTLPSPPPAHLPPERGL